MQLTVLVFPVKYIHIQIRFINSLLCSVLYLILLSHLTSFFKLGCLFDTYVLSAFHSSFQFILPVTLLEALHSK